VDKSGLGVDGSASVFDKTDGGGPSTMPRMRFGIGLPAAVAGTDRTSLDEVEALAAIVRTAVIA
jgi:hypothetical protein